MQWLPSCTDTANLIPLKKWLGASILWCSIIKGTQRPWKPWPDTSLSIYLDVLAFRSESGKKPTLPGIESLSVYLEVQI